MADTMWVMKSSKENTAIRWPIRPCNTVVQYAAVCLQLSSTTAAFQQAYV